MRKKLHHVPGNKNGARVARADALTQMYGAVAIPAVAAALSISQLRKHQDKTPGVQGRSAAQTK